jgi:hypothetical protein
LNARQAAPVRLKKVAGTGITVNALAPQSDYLTAAILPVEGGWTSR